VIEHFVLEHSDRKAVNAAGRQNEVVPHTRGNAETKDGSLTAQLPKLSWNVIRLKKG
jgi:alpha-N-arabinofuranosidase